MGESAEGGRRARRNDFTTETQRTRSLRIELDEIGLDWKNGLDFCFFLNSVFSVSLW
jgi:hypothetical protein